VLVAIFSIFNFSFFLLDYSTFLTPDGLVNWEVTNANSFWYEPHFLKLQEFLKVDGSLLLLLFSSLYISCLLLLALGLYTRITSIFAFGLFLFFSTELYPFLYGVDLYQSFFLLLLCFFPGGYQLSVRPKKLNEQVIERQKIAMRGIQLYLVITYFSAGFGKVQMPSWLNGKFLFLAVSDPNYQLVHFPSTLPGSVYTFFGVTVVCCELLYFILILIPYVRSILLILIVGMHLFIAVFMGLVPFGVLLAGINIIVWHPLFLTDLKNLKMIKKYEHAS
jgi:hypothetical protein